jgi:hypothetical protein
MTDIPVNQPAPRPSHSRFVVCAATWLLAAVLSGCSSSGGAVCSIRFSGDVDEEGRLGPGCALVAAAAGDAGASGDVLTLGATSAHFAVFQISINLGASPAAGTFSSETVPDWSADGLDVANCGYTAGRQAAPTGSFTMKLTDVMAAPSGTVAHGTLDMTLYVHAPPGTDCGIYPNEQVHAVF